MKRLALGLMLATSLSVPALALDVPKSPSNDDPNMKTVTYNPLQRVLVVGMISRLTTITYGPDETIKVVYFGDQANPSWIGPKTPCPMGESTCKDGGAPLKNNLTLWPIRPGRTDLEVITFLPDGKERTYQYEMVAKEADANADPAPDLTFGLAYTYPADVKAAQVQAWRVRQAVQAKRTAEDRLATDFWYGRSNYAYEAHGKRESASISPFLVRDNGRLTGFQFPGNMHTPAIYTGHCDGKTEHLVTTTPWNDWLVAQTTAPAFCLRLGDRALEVINKAPDPIGQNPGTGTVSPLVVREVISASR